MYVCMWSLNWLLCWKAMYLIPVSNICGTAYTIKLSIATYNLVGIIHPSISAEAGPYGIYLLMDYRT